MFQTFSELFCFIIKRSYALSLSHLSRLSSLGKRVQKYSLLGYTPNISGSFFEVFLKDFAKVLKDNDVVEHIFFIIKGLGQKR